jgi:hypothetical protein
MINPGTLPVQDAKPEAAAAAIAVFVEEVVARGGWLDGVPVRDPSADREGRYGYLLPIAGGGAVLILMPGASIERLRDLGAAAPCVYVGEWPWWWNDATSQAAGKTTDGGQSSRAVPGDDNSTTG